MQKTLMIIKPDAVAANHIGEIIARAEKEGFRITGLRMVQLTRQQAESFYAVHKERPFFAGLIQYITGGQVVIGRLERDNAVEHWRKVIGATDPKRAEPGSIRSQFGTDIETNAVHGSDSAQNGEAETAFFFD